MASTAMQNKQTDLLLSMEYINPMIKQDGAWLAKSTIPVGGGTGWLAE